MTTKNKCMNVIYQTYRPHHLQHQNDS